MVVALALATRIPPSVWLDEDEHMLATAVDILAEQAEQARTDSQ